MANINKMENTICLMLLVFLAYLGTNNNNNYCHALNMGSELNLKPIKFTEWSKNITYNSKTDYNPLGMQPFYNITHKIMYLFLGDDPMPEGYIVFKDQQLLLGPKVLNHEWGDLFKHYWGLLLVVLIVLLLAVSMPIIGLCFCCCRCAGACGGRSEPFDKKHDTCRRVFLGFLLIVLATGILFGVIVAFATNTYMQWGIDGATKTVRDGAADTRQFLAVTSKQVDYVLVDNYKQLSDQLENILRETPNYIITKLEQKSMASSLVYLTDFLAKLPELRQKLEKVKTITNELRVYALQLSNGLRGAKGVLLQMLNNCTVRECKEVLKEYEIGKLDADGIHYDKLPDVTEIIANLDLLMKNDIASAANQGHDVLEEMRRRLNVTIVQHTPQIIDAIDKAGQEFKHASQNISAELFKVANLIGNETKRYTDVADDYLHEYGPYRFYFGIAVCSTLLLILLCLVAALLCGICGKRPDGYGDDCCNKGSGSRFLMFAVALIFLTTSAISLVALVHFLIGTVAYRGVCMPLKDPQNDNVFAKFDSALDLNEVLNPTTMMNLKNSKSHNNNKNIKPQSVKSSTGTLPAFRISQVIAACHANQTIYEVLRMHNRIDIYGLSDYPTQYKINQTLVNLVNGIDFDDSGINILSVSDKQRILQLGDSALKNFDSSKFVDNLNDTITKHSLTELAMKLRNTSAIVTAENMKEIKTGLLNQALHLETYEQKLVIPMKNQSMELIRLSQELDNVLRYKERPFQESIPILVDEIERAQTFIHQEGRKFVKDTAAHLTVYCSGEIDRYLKMIVQAVEKRIGLCQPLARVYDASVIGVCNRFVDPMNGFWAGVSWCVILFIITLFVAVKLSSLYQKSDPYPGPLVESEYLYDAYSERDHIPLAYGPKNKRQKNKDRRRREIYEDPMVSTLHEVQTPVQAVRDTRYSDMAPKHWDGGPPRYQNPPMAPPASEYERPPPYYYPGATDTD